MNPPSYIKKYGSWKNTPKEVQDKLLARPQLTELQKLAQKENFALFILASIEGQLRHVCNIKSITIIDNVRDIQHSIRNIRHSIKHIQDLRKEKRNPNG